MIIAIDTETQGLDCRKFIMGCLVTETGNTEVFAKKEDMWYRIVQLGIAEAKKGKVLYVYGHNHNYCNCGFLRILSSNFFRKYQVRKQST